MAIYNYIALKPGNSRESTSFTSPESEHPCFTKLPFGYHLSIVHAMSSSVMNSVMNRVFGPMRSRDSLFYYFDDSIIHTISPALQLS